MHKRWLIGAAVFALVAAALAYPLIATARDDVGFCLSCHIMEPQGQSYATSYHKEEATCSTCHTGSVVQKYTDGARHMWANLTGIHPDPIEIRSASREVVAANCAQCHNPSSLHSRTKQERNQNCLQCHKGHDPNSVHVNGFGK